MNHVVMNTIYRPVFSHFIGTFTDFSAHLGKFPLELAVKIVVFLNEKLISTVGETIHFH